MLFENLYFSVIFIFILGLIIGSFLNVVILRFNTGQKITIDRSRCFSCGTELSWKNLIPVFSWLFQRGKCAYCKSKISIQYPLVEFFTGLTFLILFLKVYIPNLFFTGIEISNPLNVFLSSIYSFENLFNLFFYLIIFSTFILIFVYDIRHKIIPDEWSFGLAGFIFFIQTIKIFVFNITDFNLLILFNLFAGVILAIPFYLLWKFSDGKWIGLGDAKLVLSIGSLLGIVYGFSAIIFAFYIGALFAVAIMLIQRLITTKQNITIKTEIPFGPFLIIATLIVFLYQIDIIGLSLFI